MYKKLEALGSAFLGLFVPKVEALAATCWPACWQCNNDNKGPCNCNAPCCRRGSGYACNCIPCP
jgi:hypothetical protein